MASAEYMRKKRAENPEYREAERVKDRDRARNKAVRASAPDRARLAAIRVLRDAGIMPWHDEFPEWLKQASQEAVAARRARGDAA